LLTFVRELESWLSQTTLPFIIAIRAGFARDAGIVWSSITSPPRIGCCSTLWELSSHTTFMALAVRP